MAGPTLSRRAKIALPIVIVLFALLSWHRYSQAPSSALTEWQGEIFGTTWSVKVSTELAPVARDAIAAEIDETLARVDALMSTWKPDSELSRFNAARSTDPFPIEADTAAVFAIALEVGERSGGAFDVTVGPLVEAWGFGASGVPLEAPDAATLEALGARVGLDRLVLDRDAQPPTLTKRHPEVAADLSAVAKGHAVDRVAQRLVAAGFDGFLVEIGGELRAQGRRPDGTPWRVAIEEPVFEGRAIHRVLALEDHAIATSGEYRNYRETSDGARVSHTIDPRTARPIAHGLASVTVVHREAAWADAWATALNVLGPDEGYLLAERESLAATFIVRGGDGFEARSTPALDALAGD